jgi:hypothetical protein
MHPRVGLVTKYLSDEWFHKISVCIEEGRRLGLESWLYDEDKWPSGFAGGFATSGRPEYGAMGMGWREISGSELQEALASPETLRIFEAADERFRKLEKSGDIREGQILLFFAQPYQKNNWFNGEAYIDVLNPEAWGSHDPVRLLCEVRDWRGQSGPIL